MYGCTYNPKRFPAIIIKRTMPKATVLFFKTGKGIIIGTNNQLDVELVAKKLAKFISGVTSRTIRLAEVSITNIAAVGNLGNFFII